MRFARTVILVLFALAVSGCLAELDIEYPLPDGRIVRTKYTRWGSQSLEGVTLAAPGGWRFGLEKQKSDFQLGFDAGVVSVQAGGGK